MFTISFWLFVVLPIVGGWSCSRIAQKCRGKNARNAFQSASWGFWLLLLWNMPSLIPIPILGPALSGLFYLIPSALCFTAAANSMLKEMKAQRVGEYTDAA